MGRVEIRIVLDEVEPPAGRLRILPDPGRGHWPEHDEEIRFTGWLELLKALYERPERRAAHRAGSGQAAPAPLRWPVIRSSIR